MVTIEIEKVVKETINTTLVNVSLEPMAFGVDGAPLRCIHCGKIIQDAAYISAVATAIEEDVALHVACCISEPEVRQIVLDAAMRSFDGTRQLSSR